MLELEDDELHNTYQGEDFFRAAEDECYKLLKRAIKLTKDNPNEVELMKLFSAFNNLNELTIQEAEEYYWNGPEDSYSEDLDIIIEERNRREYELRPNSDNPI